MVVPRKMRRDDSLIRSYPNCSRTIRLQKSQPVSTLRGMMSADAVKSLIDVRGDVASQRKEGMPIGDAKINIDGEKSIALAECEAVG